MHLKQLLPSSPIKSPRKLFRRNIQVDTLHHDGSNRSSFSIGSTLSLDLTKETASPPRTILIRFDLKATQVIKNRTYALTEDERANYWYSAGEMSDFRREQACQGTMIQATEQGGLDPSSWMNTMLRAYQGFCKAESSEEIIAVSMESQHKLDEKRVGMDDYICEIVKDKRRRQKQLCLEIAHLQDATMSDESRRCSKMAKASRAISRPSRLYAAHVAQQAAATDYDC
jgi:hypothetical protein